MGEIMFIFYWPFCALLFFLPFLVRYVVPANKQSQENKPTLYYPALTRLQAAFGKQEKALPNDKKRFVLFMALWALMVLALMRPQLVDQYTQVKNEGYDLLLAVDISGSMQALDFSTQTQAKNRLDVVKEVVTEFVASRQGDRVGLILFGEDAFLHVPLTLDTLLVGEMLGNVVVGMAGQSTSIGDALGLAVRTLRERPEGSRVVVLLTDGKDTASSIPPMQAAQLAKDYDIKLYTIGVGSNGAVPFPNSFGGVSRQVVPIDEELLQQMAVLTGGAYFRATDATSLQQVYEEINRLEKTESKVQEFMIRQPLFHYPLAVAALILIGFMCLRCRALFNNRVGEGV